MKKVLHVIAVVVALLFGSVLRNPQPVQAQTTGAGLVTLTYAASLSTCAWPVGFGTNPTAGVICIYPNGTGGASFAGAVATAGTQGPFSPVIATSPTLTGTSPITVSGSTISCPTCVTGSVVTSFGSPGRTGAVTLTKADVTGTGLSVNTTTTSTSTSSLQ